MCTDDHRGRYVGRLKDTAPLRNQLAITGEHDCPGRLWRDIHRDLPAAVVPKRLGDELSPDGHCRRLLLVAAAAHLAPRSPSVITAARYSSLATTPIRCRTSEWARSTSAT